LIVQHKKKLTIINLYLEFKRFKYPDLNELV
jgi:hypothetical protein